MNWPVVLLNSVYQFIICSACNAWSWIEDIAFHPPRQDPCLRKRLGAWVGSSHRNLKKIELKSLWAWKSRGLRGCGGKGNRLNDSSVVLYTWSWRGKPAASARAELRKANADANADESFRFHNKNFDEIRCKLDSTENPRSFEKYPTPP